MWILLTAIVVYVISFEFCRNRFDHFSGLGRIHKPLRDWEFKRYESLGGEKLVGEWLNSETGDRVSTALPGPHGLKVSGDRLPTFRDEVWSTPINGNESLAAPPWWRPFYYLTAEIPENSGIHFTLTFYGDTVILGKVDVSQTTIEKPAKYERVRK